MVQSRAAWRAGYRPKAVIESNIGMPRRSTVQRPMSATTDLVPLRRPQRRLRLAATDRSFCASRDCIGLCGSSDSILAFVGASTASVSPSGSTRRLDRFGRCQHTIVRVESRCASFFRHDRPTLVWRRGPAVHSANPPPAPTRLSGAPLCGGSATAQRRNPTRAAGLRARLQRRRLTPCARSRFRSAGWRA